MTSFSRFRKRSHATRQLRFCFAGASLKDIPPLLRRSSTSTSTTSSPLPTLTLQGSLPIACAASGKASTRGEAPGQPKHLLLDMHRSPGRWRLAAVVRRRLLEARASGRGTLNNCLLSSPSPLLLPAGPAPPLLLSSLCRGGRGWGAHISNRATVSCGVSVICQGTDCFEHLLPTESTARADFTYCRP